MKVGIIVVNYNRNNLLKNCLESLQKISYTNSMIVVVDNGSTDGSQKMVKDVFPQVELLKMGYNSGFCKANNAGIDHVLGKKCDAVLLLNNDTQVDTDFLSEMVSGLNHEDKTGMIAAKILFMQRKNILDSAGLQITPDGLAKNRGLEMDESAFDENAEVFCPSGAAA